MPVFPPVTTSSRTVAVALVANIGVAIAKVTAAVLTASTAMTAEASHACADVGNQLLLVVAQRRGARPADRRHPLGHGREAYFWALLASVVVFAATRARGPTRGGSSCNATDTRCIRPKAVLDDVSARYGPHHVVPVDAPRAVRREHGLLRYSGPR